MNIDKVTSTPIENAMLTTAIYFGITTNVNTAVNMMGCIKWDVKQEKYKLTYKTASNLKKCQ
jgi:hypothetical protein